MVEDEEAIKKLKVGTDTEAALYLYHCTALFILM